MESVERIKNCVIKHTTLKGGVLVLLPTGKEVWIPLASIHDDSEIWKTGDSGTLIVAAWVAEQKGLV